MSCAELSEWFICELSDDQKNVPPHERPNIYSYWFFRDHRNNIIIHGLCALKDHFEFDSSLAVFITVCSSSLLSSDNCNDVARALRNVQTHSERKNMKERERRKKKQIYCWKTGEKVNWAADCMSKSQVYILYRQHAYTRICIWRCNQNWHFISRRLLLLLCIYLFIYMPICQQYSVRWAISLYNLATIYYIYAENTFFFFLFILFYCLAYKHSVFIAMFSTLLHALDSLLTLFCSFSLSVTASMARCRLINAIASQIRRYSGWKIVEKNIILWNENVYIGLDFHFDK